MNVSPINIVSQNILFVSQHCHVYARLIFMDFERIAFIESIQTWKYVDVCMCWKKRELQTQKTDTTHIAHPLFTVTFVPLMWLEVRRIAPGNLNRLKSQSSSCPCGPRTLSILSLPLEKLSQQLKQPLHIVTHSHHPALLLHNRFAISGIA